MSDGGGEDVGLERQEGGEGVGLVRQKRVGGGVDGCIKDSWNKEMGCIISSKLDGGVGSWGWGILCLAAPWGRRYCGCWAREQYWEVGRKGKREEVNGGRGWLVGW